MGYFFAAMQPQELLLFEVRGFIGSSVSLERFYGDMLNILTILGRTKKMIGSLPYGFFVGSRRWKNHQKLSKGNFPFTRSKREAIRLIQRN